MSNTAELIADLPPALKDHASWLINAGADDTARILSQMEATPEAIRTLKAAIATELAKPKHQQRPSRLKPIQAKLRKFESCGPAQSQIVNRQSSIVNVEIVTASQVSTAELASLAESITRSREIIHQHEQLCHETTLEHYLDAGQQLALAQEIFTLSVPNPTGRNQHSKKVVSTVDITPQESPEVLANRGFSAWLASALPTLKRPTAIRYARAFRSLDLPLTAKPAEIRAKLKTLRHQAGKAKLPMPTLSALLKAAPKPPEPEIIISRPPDSKQLRLEDARESLQNWKDAWEKFVKSGQLDDLTPRDMAQLKEFHLGIGDRIKARLK